MSNELDTLDTTIILANEETTDDAFGMLLGAISCHVNRLKEMKAAVEAKMMEKIKATGCDIVIGQTRFYIGTPKKVKCRDIPGTINEVLNASGGDVEKFAACLSANAFKYGTVRTLFEEVGDATAFDRLFETTQDESLEEGKPKKKLLSTNTAFSR